jgi:hypothetical protein
MPVTKATIGYLSQFFVGDTSSPIGYTAMAECKSIKPNLITVPVIDATHLLSPNATEEKLPGLIKPGTIDVSGNFTGDTSQLNIATLAAARTVFPFKTTSPVNSGTQVFTITGQGFISKYDPGPFEPSKLIEFNLSIEISGAFTQTVA